MHPRDPILQSRLAHYELVGRHWLGQPVDETRL
jgi:hypothetical protein